MSARRNQIDTIFRFCMINIFNLGTESLILNEVKELITSKKIKEKKFTIILTYLHDWIALN